MRIKKLLPMVAMGLAMMLNVKGVSAEEIRMKGSTTVLPIGQICAEEFMKRHPHINMTVGGGGSGVGISSLIDGITDIAMSSRPMRDREIEKARGRGIEPKEYMIANDGLVVIVHPNNTVRGLSKQQIKDIYTGKISYWDEVGGRIERRVGILERIFGRRERRERIVVVSRDIPSGTFVSFSEMALDKEKVRPDSLTLISNHAVATAVAKTPGAIGYIGLGYLREGVKGIEFEGVFPTKENILGGEYMLSRALYMYTRGEPTGGLKKFMEFVLSEEGQILVEKQGFIKVK